MYSLNSNSSTQNLLLQPPFKQAHSALFPLSLNSFSSTPISTPQCPYPCSFPPIYPPLLSLFQWPQNTLGFPACPQTDQNSLFHLLCLPLNLGMPQITGLVQWFRKTDVSAGDSMQVPLIGLSTNHTWTYTYLHLSLPWFPTLVARCRSSDTAKMPTQAHSAGTDCCSYRSCSCCLVSPH